jgi:hypothetical protein
MEIVFPTSTAPSRNPTEAGGRLINAYAEKAPDGARSQLLWRRAPGLETAFTAGEGTVRGTLLVGSVLYIANDDNVYSVTKAGTTYTVNQLSGTLGGDGPVIFSHNMASPSEDILIVHSDGMASIASSTVSSFSDADLPSVNSITFMDAFFFVTSADGRCFSSDVNDTEFQGTNYITAEASPDGLVRAVASGRDLLLMGQNSTEFYGNTGNATGFPFSRGPVIDIGLLSTYAVAGFDRGFPGALCWVGNDKAIYRLDGYTPTRISTPHIERLLEQVSDTSDLRASVYVAAGHPCWVLKSPDWTIVHDLSTGSWHERRSYQRVNWRAVFSVNAFSEWLVFDDADGTVYRVNDRVFKEAGEPLIWEVRSAQQHNFPARTAVDRASFDFVTGVGSDRGIAPIETTPRASISWSDDGGRTFGNALLRDLGTQGEVVPVDIWRTGLTGRHGRQWRLQVSDPVDVCLMGGSMFGEARAS